MPGFVASRALGSLEPFDGGGHVAALQADGADVVVGIAEVRIELDRGKAETLRALGIAEHRVHPALVGERICGRLERRRIDEALKRCARITGRDEAMPSLERLDRSEMPAIFERDDLGLASGSPLRGRRPGSEVESRGEFTVGVGSQERARRIGDIRLARLAPPLTNEASLRVLRVDDLAENVELGFSER